MPVLVVSLLFKFEFNAVRFDELAVPFVEPTDEKLYDDSGGRKANLAAIVDGIGGQQNRKHNSLIDNPFICCAEGCGVATLCSLKKKRRS